MNASLKARLFRTIVILAMLVMLPVSVAGAQESVGHGPATPFDAEFDSTAVYAAPAPAPRTPPIGPALSAGAARLAAMQGVDGGWGWPLTAPPEYFNTLSPIAMGLGKGFEHGPTAATWNAIGEPGMGA